LALIISHRHSAEQEPAIFSIESLETRFFLTRLARSEQAEPRFHQLP